MLGLIGMICLQGCGSAKKESAQSKQVLYTAVDEAGRTLTFEKIPTRIVSLSYPTDEIVTALVPQEHILSYSKWSGDPNISYLTKEQVDKVGKKALDSQEAIFSLRPDLVIATNTGRNDMVSGLESMGLKVYVASSPKTYEDCKTKVTKLAHALGADAKAKIIVENMDKRLLALQKKLSQLKENEKKVCVAFSFSGAMGRRGGLLDDIMHNAGLINGAALVKNGATGSTIMSKEQIVRINPDVFLVPTWKPNSQAEPEGLYNEIKNDPAFVNVKAVKNNAIYYTNDKYRYVGSHYVIDAIEAHAKIVYPQLFKN
ncbi:MAG: ABC transporter substrate-binding protein [Phascolarctobacterium sp.]|nr:ABC transporter substrate-binding protein [Phascolarctobacterium sp.]